MTCAGCGKTITPSGPYDRRRKWCSDRCRKAQYGGTCMDCGARTDGSNGREKAPLRCHNCAETINAERNQRILDGWDRGDKAWEIAEREGITENAVLSWLDTQRRLLGKPISRHQLPKTADAVEARRQRIVALWAEGKTQGEIAKAIGSTERSVCFMVQKMRHAGYDLPYRKPWLAKVAA